MSAAYECFYCHSPIRRGDRCSCGRGWFVVEAEGEDVDDLVTWLRGVLDEEERAARAARGESWAVEPFRPSSPGALPGSTWLVTGTEGADGVAVVNGSYRADHMARHDPARVLREVEAKRRIIDEHAPVPVNFGDETACTECARAPLNGYCTTLRLLALPYADRPGYREEWRP